MKLAFGEKDESAKQLAICLGHLSMRLELSLSLPTDCIDDALGTFPNLDR